MKEKIKSIISYIFGYKKSSKDSPSKIIKKPTSDFSPTYDYYKDGYPTDLDIFKKACPSYKHVNGSENQSFFVQDLTFLKESDHVLLKNKDFMYYMVINTALLMTTHKYHENKYEEFKKRNNGIVFEFGLTDTFISPWEILQMLNIPFDKRLFSSCLGSAINRLMTDDYFCGLVPDDFMSTFIYDIDLNKSDTIYGKEWRSICLEEWANQIFYLCPKDKESDSYEFSFKCKSCSLKFSVCSQKHDWSYVNKTFCPKCGKQNVRFLAKNVYR